MTINPTSGGGLLGDIFGTGASPGGFDLEGLIGNPLLQFGLTTLANNGDVSKGLQQALVAGQLQSRNARDAKRDEREDKRFQWEEGDYERTQAQRQQYEDTLSGGADLGLTQEQIATARMLGPEAGARYIAQTTNQPSFETVQNPYGRGGIGQRNSRTGQIIGYQGPVSAPQETYGDPVAVVGPDGNETFIRYGNRGGQIPVRGGFAPAPDKDDVNKYENNLRDDFNAVTKDYRAIEDAYSRIQASAKNPSAAGDMALIFNYMKLLDPGSVVRESEFQLAGEAGSLPVRVQGAFNRVQNGQRLADEQRADFVGRSHELYTAQYGNYEAYANEYRGIAERMGLNPENVIVRLPKAESLANQSSGGTDPKSMSDAEILQQLGMSQ